MTHRAILTVALLAACVDLPSGGSSRPGADGDASSEPGVIPDKEPVVEVPEPNTEALVVLTSAEPAQGRTAGAELVVLTGSGFVDGMKVWFENVPAGEVHVLSPIVAHVRTPAHAAGPVDLRVVRSDGETATLEDGFKFKDAISVHSVFPAEGPREGGTAVAISGEGFTEDTRVLLGGRLLVDAQIVDRETILAISPPGESAGPADVLVFTDWTNTVAEGAFRYTEPPTIDIVDPSVGDTDAPTLVRVVGRGLDQRSVVTFGGVDAPIISVAPGSLLVRVPQQAIGLVDVHVTSPDGEASANDAFGFRDLPTFTPDVTSYWPRTGPEAGGTRLHIGVVGAMQFVEVTIHGQPAPIEMWATNGVVVRTPPGTGAVTIDVRVDGLDFTLPEPFVYTSTPTIDAVEPERGPTTGGTEVVLSGDFPSDAEVFFGGIPAVILERSSTTLRVRTPAGSPGAVPVRVSGAVELLLESGFVYEAPGGPALYAVHPTTGAIAGNTLLRVFGAGFTPDAVLKFANKALPNLEVISPTELRVRTIPADEPTTVDVKLDQGDDQLVLGDAFAYFDPASPYGGAWGPEIRGALNVTVLDIMTTDPVPAAFVMLWSDPSTPYRGYTDERGQVTFSGLDLVGPQMLTAAKTGYTAYSVVEVNAQNVTVHLIPPASSSSGGGGGGGPQALQPAQLEGRVLGLGKYIVPPPKACSYMAQKGLVGAEGTASCAPCAIADDCGPGYQCRDIANEGRRCALTCATSDDCPGGYICGAGVEGAAACIPDPGRRAAYCMTTSNELWADPPAANPMFLQGVHYTWATGDNRFSLSSRLGELALICVGGVIQDEADAFGSFVPVAMGVARHITANSGALITDIDVMLDIPLRKTVPLRLDGAPTTYRDPVFGGDAPTSTNLRVSLDFGAEGYWKIHDKTLPGATDFALTHQPENLAGKLDEVTYLFLAVVKGGSALESGTQAYRVKVLDTDTLFNWVDGSWKAEHTGITRDLFGMWGLGDQHLWAVGADGLIAHRRAGGWFPQFSPTDETLRGVHGVGEEFALAVGDKGTIVVFDGVSWKSEASGTAAPLYAAAGTGPLQAFAVGEATALYRDTTGWHPLPGAPATALRGAWSPTPTSVWAVGDDGTLWMYDRLTPGWKAETLTSSAIPLYAISGRSAADVWVVGSAGTVLHRTAPGTTERVEVPTQAALYGLALHPDGRVVAAGARGTLLTFDGNGWAVGTAEQHAGDLRAAAFLDDPEIGAIVGGSQAVTLGPMLSFPELQDPNGQPIELQPFTYHLHWEAKPSASPTFNFVEMLYSNFPMWWTVVDAAAQDVTFPNLPMVEGITPWISPQTLIRVNRVLKPGVTVDNFDFWDTYDTSSWQSWSWGTAVVTTF